MRKAKVLTTVSVSLVLFYGSVCVAQGFKWEDLSRGNTDSRAVLLGAHNPNIIFAGFGGAVYKSQDGGLSWRNILLVKAQNKKVNFLAVEAENKTLYAAGGGGLFRSLNLGKNWSRIFKGRNYLENECTGLAVFPSGIYLGTAGGLFISKDKGRSWHKAAGALGSSHIFNIAYNQKEPGCLYTASKGGVFKTIDSGASWERVFVSSTAETEEDAEEDPAGLTEGEGSLDMSCIAIDPNNPSCLYIGSGKGVYKTQDSGKSWERLSSYGLLSQDVKFISIVKDGKIYAVTKSGIFEYDGERWFELSFELNAGEIRFITCDNQGNLYAACEKGLFRQEKKWDGSIFEERRMAKNRTVPFLSGEPDIKDVQKAAIRYAEVEPDKIIQWRKKAAKQAALPKVSIGVNRDTSDLWHWESGSTTKAGDDVLIRGRQTVGWDVSLSWDLGELIWSADQTSIDARSRLMVQLRDDILDEVTRLYFERLRVKMELDNLSIEDRKKRSEKGLRLEELTAMLDGLTNGYFSQHL